MRFVLLLLMIAHWPAFALELYAWRAYDSLPALVLPVFAGETPEQAARRYVSGVESDPGLQELLKRDPLPPLPFRAFARLDDSDLYNRILLLANRPSDYQPNGNWRIDSFARPIAANGRNSYMLPFAYDAGLTAAQARQFMYALDRRFPAWFVLGGDDLALNLLGRSTEGSMFMSERRDRAEMQLVRWKIETVEQHRYREREDALIGICRGAQQIAALMDWQVQTHIDHHGGHSERPRDQGNDGGAATPKGEKLHPLQVLPTTQNIVAQTLAGFTDSHWANTYHHQCALPGGSTRLQLAAINPHDGCAEAYESPRGRIVGLQWHPELMAVRNDGRISELGHHTMARLIEFLTPAARCEQRLSAARR